MYYKFINVGYRSICYLVELRVLVYFLCFGLEGFCLMIIVKYLMVKRLLIEKLKILELSVFFLRISIVNGFVMIRFLRFGFYSVLDLNNGDV